MPRGTALTVLAFISLLLASGCGSQQMTDKSVDSVSDLRSRITDLDVPCDSEKSFRTSGIKEAISCGGNVWLTVYENDEQKNARISEYKSKKNRYLEGSNWTVIGPQEQLEKLTS